MDITTMSVTELKALKYDQLVELDRVQKNIQVLDQQLQKALSKPVDAPIVVNAEVEAKN